MVSPRVIVTNRVYSTFLISADIKKSDSQTAFFQTDTQGTVTVLTDGKMLRIKTYLDENKEFLH
jgi:hypothetical protein